MLFSRISDEFEVTEELASLSSLCGIIIGENIYKEIKKTSNQYRPKWNLLICVITDDDKNICETEKFFDKFTNWEKVRCLKYLVIHCIIHQKVL